MRRRAVIFLLILGFLTANSPTIADEQLKGGPLAPYAKARLGTTIFRSPVYLERMAYSPKGTYLVTLDAKGTIRFSNPKTGQLHLRLETKPPSNSRKESLFFSPVERFVFWSNAETMHCREISSGTEHYFKVDQPPCGRIALIMADEQMQFAYASGGSIFLLKGSKKSDFHALKGHLKRVTAVAASRSGQWIGFRKGDIVDSLAHSDSLRCPLFLSRATTHYSNRSTDVYFLGIKFHSGNNDRHTYRCALSA